MSGYNRDQSDDSTHPDNTFTNNNTHNLTSSTSQFNNSGIQQPQHANQPYNTNFGAHNGNYQSSSRSRSNHYSHNNQGNRPPYNQQFPQNNHTNSSRFSKSPRSSAPKHYSQNQFGPMSSSQSPASSFSPGHQQQQFQHSSGSGKNHTAIFAPSIPTLTHSSSTHSNSSQGQQQQQYSTTAPPTRLTRQNPPWFTTLSPQTTTELPTFDMYTKSIYEERQSRIVETFRRRYPNINPLTLPEGQVNASQLSKPNIQGINTKWQSFITLISDPALLIPLSESAPKIVKGGPPVPNQSAVNGLAQKIKHKISSIIVYNQDVMAANVAAMTQYDTDPNVIKLMQLVNAPPGNNTPTIASPYPPGTPAVSLGLPITPGPGGSVTVGLTPTPGQHSSPSGIMPSPTVSTTSYTSNYAPGRSEFISHFEHEFGSPPGDENGRNPLPESPEPAISPPFSPPTQCHSGPNDRLTNHTIVNTSGGNGNHINSIHQSFHETQGVTVAHTPTPTPNPTRTKLMRIPPPRISHTPQSDNSDIDDNDDGDDGHIESNEKICDNQNNRNLDETISRSAVHTPAQTDDVALVTTTSPSTLDCNKHTFSGHQHAHGRRIGPPTPSPSSEISGLSGLIPVDVVTSPGGINQAIRPKSSALFPVGRAQEAVITLAYFDLIPPQVALALSRVKALVLPEYINKYCTATQTLATLHYDRHVPFSENNKKMSFLQEKRKNLAAFQLAELAYSQSTTLLNPDTDLPISETQPVFQNELPHGSEIAITTTLSDSSQNFNKVKLLLATPPTTTSTSLELPSTDLDSSQQEQQQQQQQMSKPSSVYFVKDSNSNRAAPNDSIESNEENGENNENGDSNNNNNQIDENTSQENHPTTQPTPTAISPSARDHGLLSHEDRNPNSFSYLRRYCGFSVASVETLLGIQKVGETYSDIDTVVNAYDPQHIIVLVNPDDPNDTVEYTIPFWYINFLVEIQQWVLELLSIQRKLASIGHAHGPLHTEIRTILTVNRLRSKPIEELIHYFYRTAYLAYTSGRQPPHGGNTAMDYGELATNGNPCLQFELLFYLSRHQKAFETQYFLTLFSDPRRYPNSYHYFTEENLPRQTYLPLLLAVPPEHLTDERFSVERRMHCIAMEDRDRTELAQMLQKGLNNDQIPDRFRYFAQASISPDERANHQAYTQKYYQIPDEALINITSDKEFIDMFLYIRGVLLLRGFNTSHLEPFFHQICTNLFPNSETPPQSSLFVPHPATPDLIPTQIPPPTDLDITELFAYTNTDINFCPPGPHTPITFNDITPTTPSYLRYQQFLAESYGLSITTVNSWSAPCRGENIICGYDTEFASYDLPSLTLITTPPRKIGLFQLQVGDYTFILSRHLIDPLNHTNPISELPDSIAMLSTLTHLDRLLCWVGILKSLFYNPNITIAGVSVQEDVSHSASTLNKLLDTVEMDHVKKSILFPQISEWDQLITYVLGPDVPLKRKQSKPPLTPLNINHQLFAGTMDINQPLFNWGVMLLANFPHITAEKSSTNPNNSGSTHVVALNNISIQQNSQTLPSFPPPPQPQSLTSPTPLNQSTGDDGGGADVVISTTAAKRMQQALNPKSILYRTSRAQALSQAFLKQFGHSQNTGQTSLPVPDPAIMATQFESLSPQKYSLAKWTHYTWPKLELFKEPVTMSNWERYPLHHEQLIYAGLDAYISLQLMRQGYNKCVQGNWGRIIYPADARRILIENESGNPK